MTTHVYQSGFDLRTLTLEPAKAGRLHYTLRASGAWLASGHAAQDVDPRTLAEDTERTLPFGAQIWQRRDFTAHNPLTPSLIPFPDAYCLVAVMEETVLERVFDRAQHRPMTDEEHASGVYPGWHQRPGVHARRAARITSLSVGDVICLPADPAEPGTVLDLLGRPLLALRVLGSGWERLGNFALALTRHGPTSCVNVDVGPGLVTTLGDLEFDDLRCLLESAGGHHSKTLGGLYLQRSPGGLLVQAAQAQDGPQVHAIFLGSAALRRAAGLAAAL